MRIVMAGFFVLLTTFFPFAVQRPQPNPVGRWQPSEVIQAQDLIIKVRDNGPSKPLIVFTGFMGPYRAGHIPGAVFGGPASSPALGQWEERSRDQQGQRLAARRPGLDPQVGSQG